MHTWQLLSKRKKRLVLLGVLDIKIEICSLEQSGPGLQSKKVGCNIQQYTRLQLPDIDFSSLLGGRRMKPEEKARHYYHLTRKGWGKSYCDSYPLIPSHLTDPVSDCCMG